MKDRARRGPTQSTGRKVGFLQLVRIMKKWVGEAAAPFLEDKGTRSETPEKAVCRKIKKLIQFSTC